MLPTIRRIFDVPAALNSLRPTSAWTHSGDSVAGITWLDPDTACPTEQEITDEIARLQAQYDAEFYRIERAAAYPAIGDQLDALYHAGVFPAEMAAQIRAVKDRYPKP
jgi:hypothetical protein